MKFRSGLVLGLTMLTALSWAGAQQSLDSVFKKKAGESSTAVMAEQSDPAEWLVMVYFAADNDINRYALMTMNELEAVGSSEDVKTTVFMDFQPWVKDENGKQVRKSQVNVIRGLVKKAEKPGDFPTFYESETTEYLDKNVDSGDAQTLADYIRWATTKYPAKRYSLFLWSHGDGWRDLSSVFKQPDSRSLTTQSIRDFDAPSTRSLNFTNSRATSNFTAERSERAIPTTHSRGICVDSSSGNSMYMKDVREAIESSGIHLEVLGLNACLMGMLEVVYEFKDLATYVVASEQTVFAPGFEFTSFLGALQADPLMDAKTFGIEILKGFNERWGKEEDQTLSLVETSRMDLLVANLNSLVQEISVSDNQVKLSEENWLPYRDSLVKARMAAGPEMGGTGQNNPLPFIDFGAFLEGLVNQSDLSPALRRAAAQTLEAYKYAINGYVVGQEKSRTGLAVFFPRNLEWEKYDAFSLQTYTADNSRFARDTLWRHFVLSFAANKPMKNLGTPDQAPATPAVKYKRK